MCITIAFNYSLTVVRISPRMVVFIATVMDVSNLLEFLRYQATELHVHTNRTVKTALIGFTASFLLGTDHGQCRI